MKAGDNCPICGSKLTGNAHSCTVCGTNFGDDAKVICPECGATLPADAVSCQECGTHVVIEAPEIQDEEEPVFDSDDEEKEIDEEREPAEAARAEIDVDKMSVECKELMKLPGIGPMKATILYEAGYTDLRKIKRASVVELLSIDGIGKKDAGRIKAELRERDLLDIRSIELTDEGIVKEYQCPLCGTIVSEFENVCYECGTMLKKTDDMLNGDTEKALAFYDEKLINEPNNAELWYARGATLMGMEDFEHALSSFEKALEIEPDNQNAWISKAELFNKMGEPLKAAECFTHVISHSSDEPYLSDITDTDSDMLGEPEEAVDEVDETDVEEPAAEEEAPPSIDASIMPGMVADQEHFGEEDAEAIEPESESEAGAEEEPMLEEEQKVEEEEITTEETPLDITEEPAYEEEPIELVKAEPEVVEETVVEEEPAPEPEPASEPLPVVDEPSEPVPVDTIPSEPVPVDTIPSEPVPVVEEPPAPEPQTFEQQDVIADIQPKPEVAEEEPPLEELDPKILRKMLSDHAADVKPLLILAKEMDVDINPQKLIISKAVKASKRGDYHAAIETMKEGKAAIFDLFHDKIRDDLNALAVVAREVKMEGHDVGGILSNISTAKEKLGENKFKEAFDLLNICLNTLENIRSG